MMQVASKPVGPSSSPEANQRFADVLKKVLSVSSQEIQTLRGARSQKQNQHEGSRRPCASVKEQEETGHSISWVA